MARIGERGRIARRERNGRAPSFPLILSLRPNDKQHVTVCHTVTCSYLDLFLWRIGLSERCYLGHASTDVQGVASDPIIFNVPIDAQAKTKTKTSKPLSLPVNEEAITATGDGAKSRSKGNRLPALT